EEVLACLSSRQPKILVNGQAGLVRQLEPHWPARLLLSDGCSIHGISARRHVIDPQGHNVTSAQLLSIARLKRAKSRLRSAICNFVRMDQTWLGRSGGFAPMSLPLFQGMRADLAATSVAVGIGWSSMVCLVY